MAHKRVPSIPEMPLPLLFQFHSGTSKSLPTLPVCIDGFTFQFHSGTSKSIPVPPECVDYCSFQFHSGTSKRDKAIVYYDEKKSFNRTLQSPPNGE